MPGESGHALREPPTRGGVARGGVGTTPLPAHKGLCWIRMSSDLERSDNALDPRHQRAKPTTGVPRVAPLLRAMGWGLRAEPAASGAEGSLLEKNVERFGAKRQDEKMSR